jgi:hypothetical protein
LQKKQVDNDPDDPFSQLSFYVVQVGDTQRFGTIEKPVVLSR